ncbi:MAG: DUF881 domain-containing protein [Bifidobacteriaceae bacterium]|jgi:uncharacterized protein YlxW (UPF0749 family)|nr:DUF881 domain-containing protein [Bifidobacteriaceae bacterium]
MRRPDESMTLLKEVLARPLDGGYAEAARRRALREGAAGGSGPTRAGAGARLRREQRPDRRPDQGPDQRRGWWRDRRRGWLAVLVAALVLGLAGTWGARILRSQDESEQRARQALERAAAESQERVGALRQRTSQLAGEVEALENQALQLTDPSAAAEARALAISVGAIAAAGPGLVLSITEDAEAVAVGSDEARIRSGDLRIVVGALWQSGAEAIAVGGVRLASTTAIRDVGDQIQVGFESLGTPYVIEAIGPAADMQVGLAAGRAADRIGLLRGYLGAEVAIRAVDQVELPASAAVAGLEHVAVAAEVGAEGSG